MGIFGGLDADQYDRQYSDGYLAKRITNYILNYRREMIGVVVGFMALAIVAALRPSLSRQVWMLWPTGITHCN